MIRDFLLVMFVLETKINKRALWTEGISASIELQHCRKTALVDRLIIKFISGTPAAVDCIESLGSRKL